MPLGSVNVAAFGTWMAASGGYLRSLGERVPLPAAGAGADPRPRPAVASAGFAVLAGPDPTMPCARAAAATRRMPRRVLIRGLRSCAPAVWAARHRTGRGARSSEE